MPVSSTVSRTHLWSQSLSAQGDEYDEYRSVFRESFQNFRERIGNVVRFIPEVMRDFTVHDITHLDALWETADLIAGKNFILNPAEAYVFGGAVLLHDAAMASVAYPGGVAQIMATPEWSDAIALAAESLELAEATGEPQGNIQFKAALSDFLRAEHARKAEELATQFWINPKSGNQEYLIQDSDLRAHFGATIGKVAHSHHWSVRRLLSDLQPSVGAFKDTPADWTVDCLKVALLLRCADAAHIDHRRAPRFLLTLTKPEGLSLKHWSFQEKLAKPQALDSRLLYTSREAFGIEDADSWQLCWDTIKMIDRELNDAQGLFLDNKKYPFCVTGVIGARSPEDLVRHVEVNGWKPVPADIQVSDVPSLARTLGGRDLYSSKLAPLRELIQNSADAIDARVAVDPEFSAGDGRIVIRIVESGDAFQVSVADNGIGMSERTLTGALIDFGLSFWKSDAARTEYPGLVANFSPRGRYGIGFFSVFMWADRVKVCTRKFLEGSADTRVLEFREGLGRRPILRGGSSDERSLRFSTRILLTVTKQRWEELCTPAEHEGVMWGRSSRDFDSILSEAAISRLCAMLRFPVILDDGVSERQLNMPDWQTADSDQFLSYFARLVSGDLSATEARFARSEAVVRMPSSEGGGVEAPVVGRAFLKPSLGTPGVLGQLMSTLLVYEKGIFIGYKQYAGNICGFIEGRATNAARDKSEDLNPLADAEWVERQMDYMSRLTLNLGEAVACQEAALQIDRIIPNLPFLVLARKPITLNQFLERVGSLDRVRITLSTDYNSPFKARRVDDVSAFIGVDVDESRVFFLAELPGELREGDSITDYVRDSKSVLANFLRTTQQTMGPGALIKVTIADADTYTRRRLMALDIVKSQKE